MGLLDFVAPFVGIVHGLLAFGIGLWTLASAATFIVLTIRAFRSGWRGMALNPLWIQLLLAVAMIIIAHAVDESHSWQPTREELTQTLSILSWIAVAAWGWLIALNFKRPAR